MTRAALIVVTSGIVLAVGALVVWSIAGDAAVLADAFGWWGLSLFLVVPALVGLTWWRNR